jgi:hypothetical protein
MRHRLPVAAVMVGLGHCGRQRFRAVARQRRALAEAELLRSPIRTKTKAAKVASPNDLCSSAPHSSCRRDALLVQF